MLKPRVWIQFNPQLYTDLIKKILQSTDWVEVVELNPFSDLQQVQEGQVEANIDLIVSSLDVSELPEMARMVECMPGATFIAFSLNGDYGIRRKPGDCNWEELRPFGVQQLMHEVAGIRKVLKL